MPSFEELAARLTQAANPTERMAAAEELSRLNDRRVAAALARALADPDPGVRSRVEELLGQFCRSDAAGSLQVLLDEAERVADALAMEVHRLRGGGSQELAALPGREAADEARLGHPIEPPEGYEGECALIRLAPKPHEVKPASAIVAKGVGVARFLVAREVQTTKGFLARGVRAVVAAALVRELHEAGIVAGAVPMEQVPAALAPMRLRGPVFDRDALRGTIVPGGEVCEVAWSTVVLAVAARMEIELKRDARDEDWSLFTRPIKAGGGRTHQTGYDYVVELFAGEPLRRFRLGTHELDFDIMQRRPSSFGRVARLGRRLARRLDRRRINAGLRRLEEQDDEDWDDLTFVSPPGFESYVAWLRLLIDLGVPLPR